MEKQDEKIIIGILELAKIGFYVELKEEFREMTKTIGVTGGKAG